jgi:hypothetical protein
MLGLIKCRVCDEDIEVYDAERVIIHYSTCSRCRASSDRQNETGADLSFRSDWRQS